MGAQNMFGAHQLSAPYTSSAILTSIFQKVGITVLLSDALFGVSLDTSSEHIIKCTFLHTFVSTLSSVVSVVTPDMSNEYPISHTRFATSPTAMSSIMSDEYMASNTRIYSSQGVLHHTRKC
jgi:hypothetical protein